MKKLLMAFIALAFLAAPAFAQSCSDALGCVELSDDDPIVVGYMLTTSGGTAFFGDDSLGGIEIAIEQRGAELLGREVILVGEDSLCSAEGGQTAAQRMAADPDVVGIVGTNCSGAATGAMPILSEAGMSLISPSNTSPALTNPDETYLPGYYRTAHNDNFQGALAAKFAFEELGSMKVATVHDGDPYTEGLAAVMAREFAAIGGEVVFQGAVNKTDTDMTSILTDIAASGADVIFFPLFPPTVDFFVSQSQNISGLENVTLFSTDSAMSDEFPETNGEASIGMYMSGPYITNSKYDQLIADWDDIIGGSPPAQFHAHAYDATNMILDAIEAVAVETADGGLLIGRQAIRDALTAIEGYEGVIGKISCDDTGDCATGEALGVFQITQAEVDGAWPPQVIYTPAGGSQ